MTDLKAAAKAAKAAVWPSTEYIETTNEFQRLASPDAVLALYAERDEARAEAKRVMDLTQDANAVHINMLRGGMARLTWEQIKHLYAAEFAAAEASLASYKEEVERLRRALAEARDDMQAWQSYASDYFRDKHDAAGDLAKIDQALTKETPHADVP